jgi:hypothetical protein
MGTRSLTHIVQSPAKGKRKPEVLATIYRQFDGYPSGHGEDLLRLLKDKVMVNGIGRESGDIANGAGCLAAQIVRDLKTEAGVGGIYLEPAGSEDHGEEYVYTVEADTFDPQAGIQLKVEAIHGGYGDTPRERKVLFAGAVRAFDPAKAEAVEA